MLKKKYNSLHHIDIYVYLFNKSEGSGGIMIRSFVTYIKSCYRCDDDDDDVRVVH